MVHFVVILSTITVYGMAEKWFMLLLYCLPLLLKVDRGVVHVVVAILHTITV